MPGFGRLETAITPAARARPDIASRIRFVREQPRIGETENNTTTCNGEYARSYREIRILFPAGSPGKHKTQVSALITKVKVWVIYDARACVWIYTRI